MAGFSKKKKKKLREHLQHNANVLSEFLNQKFLGLHTAAKTIKVINMINAEFEFKDSLAFIILECSWRTHNSGISGNIPKKKTPTAAAHGRTSEDQDRLQAVGPAQQRGS
jgi:hypothetical protein